MYTKGPKKEGRTETRLDVQVKPDKNFYLYVALAALSQKILALPWHGVVHTYTHKSCDVEQNMEKNF